MVSGQNLKLIAPHLLAGTHLCLMGVDVRKILEASNPAGRLAGSGLDRWRTDSLSSGRCWVSNKEVQMLIN